MNTKIYEDHIYHAGGCMRGLIFTLLLLVGCGPAVRGNILDPVKYPLWYDAIPSFVNDWNEYEASEENPDSGPWYLPSIASEECQRWIAETQIVQYSSAQEWMDNRGTCPCMPAGETSPVPCNGREHTSCIYASFEVTGPLGPNSKRPYIFLAPGESADGHMFSVRHEMAHILAGCVGWDGDIGHNHPILWDGGRGLVWRPNQ